VSVTNNVAFIGDNGSSTKKGKVWIYSIANVNLQAAISSPDSAPGDNFGMSVKGYNLTFLVGQDNNGSAAGSAYIFNISPFELLQTITSTSPINNDRFGSSVSISEDDRVAVGKPGDNAFYLEKYCVW